MKLLILFFFVPFVISQTALDDYVNLDDGFFSWDFITSYRYEGVTMYMLNMTSQKWLDENWSNNPVWTHLVGIAVPDTIRTTDAGFMFVVATDYTENPDYPGIPVQYSGYNMFTVLAARLSGTIWSYVANIPNQPIVFVEDPKQMERSEDDQIAFTWRQFYSEDQDIPEQLNYFAMVKGASKGLTTIQEFTSQQFDFVNITRFGVLGGSKRGATTWMLSAMDDRVNISFPTVYPLLKMQENLQNHFQGLGGWTFAFEPYFNEQLTPYLTSNLTQLLASYIDPYTYRDRLTMRKYVLTASTDEFFMVDETRLWWNELPQPMDLMMVANANHVMSPRYIFVLRAVLGYWLAYLEDFDYPSMTWKLEENDTNGTVTVYTSRAPSRVRGYVSTTVPEVRRDFRRRAGFPEQLQGTYYNQTQVEDLGGGVFRITVEQPPENHFSAFFIEATWPGVESFNITLTSEMNVIPGEYPYPPCEGIQCYGELV